MTDYLRSRRENIERCISGSDLIERNLENYIYSYQRFEETESYKKEGKMVLEEIEKDIQNYTKKLLMKARNAVAVLKIMQEKKELPNLYDKLPEELVREIASYIPAELGRAVMIIRARNITTHIYSDHPDFPEIYKNKIRYGEIVNKLNMKQLTLIAERIIVKLRGDDIANFPTSGFLKKNYWMKKNPNKGSIRDFLHYFLYHTHPPLYIMRDKIEQEYRMVSMRFGDFPMYYIKAIYEILGVLNYYGKRDYGI